MSASKQRREAAQKRAKKKRITILAVCAIVLVAGITTAIVVALNQPDSRVFSVPGGQSVALFENGRFEANLFHDRNITGTFTEDAQGDVTEISFTFSGTTVSTQIEDDILILPMPWRATCRFHSHEVEFVLVQ